MESVLFDPLGINLFQLIVVFLVGAAVGWLVAVELHYEQVDEFMCQLHATDDRPRAHAPLLDALAGLFFEHRLLLWRHATSKGEKPRPLNDLHSTAAYVRAYNVLRAYGRAPRTAELAPGDSAARQAPIRERRRAS